MKRTACGILPAAATTRGLTGQQIISSAGEGASRDLSRGTSRLFRKLATPPASG